MTPEALVTLTRARTLLRRACMDAGSATAWAKAHNVSRGRVCAALRGREMLSKKMAAVLGLRRVVAFEHRNGGTT